MTKMLINKINLNAPTQLRQTLESQSHVEDLAHVYAENGSFQDMPWVGVIKGARTEGGDEVMVPIDGFHRLRAIKWLDSDAYRSLEDATDVSHLDLNFVDIKITMFDSMGDAIIAAAGVNSTHGLKRRKGDIANAINAILQVDRERFTVGGYKLDKQAIMDAVNCSHTHYTKETAAIRSDLVKQRDFTILQLNEEGKSGREIEEELKVPRSTIRGVLGKDEDEELGGRKSPMGISAHPEDEPSEPSVFMHATAVEPIANPWEEYENDHPVETVKAPKVEEGMNPKQHIMSLFNQLSTEDKDALLTLMTDSLT